MPDRINTGPGGYKKGEPRSDSRAVRFTKNDGKTTTFYDCESMDEAKGRFQWVYGCWPEDGEWLN